MARDWRISEALALKKTDVDLAEAILTIRETKFYKSRLVPIGADLVGVLRHYRDQHGRKQARVPHDPFLSDHQGRPILRQTAELVFKRVREQAGLEHPTCRTFRPRLHDFRQHAGSRIMPGSAWEDAFRVCSDQFALAKSA